MNDATVRHGIETIIGFNLAAIVFFAVVQIRDARAAKRRLALRDARTLRRLGDSGGPRSGRPTPARLTTPLRLVRPGDVRPALDGDDRLGVSWLDRSALAHLRRFRNERVM